MSVPYKIIKKAMFEVDKKDLIDAQHGARLQYNLLKLDPVIKAKVEYNKALITIIYNPKSADNDKKKTDLTELKEFLEKEGIKTGNAKISEQDYDYYKEFYSYAFSPKQVRYHPPYGSKK
jgi:hypothetical protein